MGAQDTMGRLSTSQTLAGSGASTNYIKNPTAYPRLGIGKPFYVHVRVDVAPTKCTSIAVALQCHEDSSFSTGTKNFELIPDTAIASLTLGLKFDKTIPAECDEQYVRGYYTCTGGSTEDVGTFSISIDDQPTAWNDPYSKDAGNQLFTSPVGNP